MADDDQRPTSRVIRPFTVEEARQIELRRQAARRLNRAVPPEAPERRG